MPARLPKPWPSFERVLTTIRHAEPDRVPVAEVWVDPEVKRAFLGRSLRTLEDEVDFWVRAGYDFVAVDTDIYAAPQIQRCIVTPIDDTARLYEDARGQRGWVVSGAAAIRDLRDVQSFPWPRAEDIDLAVYPALSRVLPADMKIVVTIGHVFTGAWQLMGFEAFCLALFDQPEVVEMVMAHLGRETLRLLDRVLACDSVGAVCFQDDIAYTHGLMLRPEALRALFFPWLREAAQLCHASDRPLILHSDGKVDEAIPDILAAGVDVLHPIEPKCMDIEAVKREYGDRLALMGNLDLGYTLTRGTAAEVRTAVRDLILRAAPGGGFLLGSANSITNYVPLENYLAMLDAAKEFGRYPICV